MWHELRQPPYVTINKTTWEVWSYHRFPSTGGAASAVLLLHRPDAHPAYLVVHATMRRAGPLRLNWSRPAPNHTQAIRIWLAVVR